MIVLNVFFLIIGLMIGTRIGLRGLVLFCFGIGLMWVLIRVPTYLYKNVSSYFYDFMNPGTADTLALLGLFLAVLIGAIQLGWQLSHSEALVMIPEGIDHALGGAAGGALGWVIIELMLG